jgi:hypothetical protein
VKVLLAEAEQHLHDHTLDVLNPAISLGGADADLAAWQEQYLFSRAVSIYGGTRQMNLNTIANLILGLR